MSFQARLNGLFQEHPDLRPAQFAKAIGVSRTSVSDWLSGRVKTIQQSEVAEKLADFFGVNHTWLVWGIGEKYVRTINEMEPVAQEKSEQASGNIEGQALVKPQAAAILAESTYNNLQENEDKDMLSVGFVANTYNIKDPEIVSALTLLTQLNRFKTPEDKEDVIVEVIKSLSFTVSRYSISIKPLDATALENPSQRKKLPS